eukprot:1443552-Prymnesium_polylepis.1
MRPVSADTGHVPDTWWSEYCQRVVPLDRLGEQSFSSTDSCVAGTSTQDARTRHAEKGWPSRIVTDWQEQSVCMLGVRNGFHDS